jgi:hypothetical protein
MERKNIGGEASVVLVFCRRSQYVFHVEIILFILVIIKEE